MNMKNIIRIMIIGALFFGAGSTTASAQGFSDVPQSSAFYKEILHLSERGIIQGDGNGKFEPSKSVTRGDAAIMIGRVLGYSGEQQETSFDDVGKSSAASGYIQQAYENGVIQGYGDDRFGPNDSIKRGDMALLMSRAFNFEEEAINRFSDVTIQQRAYRAIRQITAAGVTQGDNEGNFNPYEVLTRAEFSAFLARATSDEFRLDVNACGYDPDSRTNPDRQTVNCLITKAALEADTIVPPEVVKSIASIENGNWQQFDSKGEPIISKDGGIGLMQLTSPYELDFNEEELKYDLTKNIEAGIKTLASKYKNSQLPSIGDKNPMNLENWYFAIMAYNGPVAENSPFYKATGDNNFDAYQVKVYADMYSYGLVEPQIFDIPMNVDDFHYGEDTNWNIIFKKDHYGFYSDYTPSKHYFAAGDQVVYVGDTLRNEPGTSGAKIPVSTSDTLEILAAPVYDMNPDSKNQYVWYPVENLRTGKKGFAASAYVRTLP
jgi:hypothetical protein